MISTPERQRAVSLIDEARTAGARLKPSCAVLGITARTYQRWTQGGAVRADARPAALRPAPSHALTEDERQAILETTLQPDYAALPPGQMDEAKPCLEGNANIRPQTAHIVILVSGLGIVKLRGRATQMDNSVIQGRAPLIGVQCRPVEPAQAKRRIMPIKFAKPCRQRPVQPGQQRFQPGLGEQ